MVSNGSEAEIILLFLTDVAIWMTVEKKWVRRRKELLYSTREIAL